MSLGYEFEILAEVGLSMLLGAIIGVERELADKPAGFRTLMLVAGASALFVGLSDLMLRRAVPDVEGGLNADRVRIIEAIVTGISFLGAGTIFRRGRHDYVEGLTTAAAILTVSAIGISVALRQFVLAIGTTALALLVLRGFPFVQNWIDRKKERRTEPTNSTK